MKPSLHPVDVTVINALSRSDVELTMTGLRKFLQRKIWLGKTNRYAKDTVNRLSKNPKNTEENRNLSQYIVASLTLHANDGWSYLGRAVACLLAGDSHRALHLAYYAELRAAMSLLAGAGIGIFNNRHFVISKENSTTKLRTQRGTHVFAWMALEHWSTQPTSGQLFANLIRPEGKSLSDWFRPHGGTITLAPQAKSWFMQWGMDLDFASKDREARNESSYRPDGIPITWVASPLTTFEFIRDMWAVLEPSSSSSFEQIDRHILRLALERHYFSLTRKRPAPTDIAFQRFIDTTISAQNLSSSAEDRLKKFFLREIVPKDPQIFKYSSMIPKNSDLDPLMVLARSVLLLRVATGSAQDLLKNVGLSASELTFWWEKLGESRGLWPAGALPTTLSDLWADVEEVLSPDNSPRVTI